ncbi:S8 family serine peptidase [Lysobacter sp. CA199]|uniref:S8 family serine peptidase n=1 Tax=Lysobacter sp. CA199 TaxID=3455608 RepID=UPI003F8D7981
MHSAFGHSPRAYRPLAIATAIATATVLAAVCAAPATAGVVNANGLQAAGQYDQFIVKYRSGSRARVDAASLNAALNRAASALPAAGQPRLGLAHLRRMSLGADVIRADRGLDRLDALALMKRIAAHPDVEYVEPDLPMRTQLTPNDSRYNEQWHYADSAAGINGPSAWDQASGAGAVVAVVDSGYLSHTDLNANLLPGYDFVTSVNGLGFACLLAGLPFNCGGGGDGNGRDNNATDSSNVKHGTHVAGTIAAVTNNNLGVAGVARDAKIVPVRVLGNSGVGNTSDIADGIVWASGGSVSGIPANANPADVINLSLGGAQPCSQTLTYRDAINAATNNGAIVVVAAGNSNTDVSGFTPASCPNTITVAASDINGNRAWYSNYGTGIDITAPGGETCSPAAEFLALGESTSGKCTQTHTERGVLSTVDANGYAFYQGTSMAAPHVAGVVALIKSVSPTLTTAQVQTILTSTARPIVSAKCPGGCGPGLIDANAAVTAAQGP